MIVISSFIPWSSKTGFVRMILVERLSINRFLLIVIMLLIGVIQF